MRMRRLSSFGLAIALGAALIACGGGDEGDEPAESAGNVGTTKTTVKAELKDLTITLDKVKAPSGQVVFEAKNTGALPHELKAVQTDLPVGSLPVADAKADESKLKLAGTIKEFPGGKTESGAFSLQPGKYVLICNVPGHYQAGMHATFTVE